MNEEEYKQEQANLRTLLEQNWLHCRHVENERAQFMHVYAVIVAGALVFLGYLYSKDITISKPETIPYILCLIIFLMAITFWGFFLALRWSQAFEYHRRAINRIVGSMLLINWQWQKPNMDVPSMPSGCLKNRYIFPFFYLLLFSVLTGLSGLYIWNVLYNSNHHSFICVVTELSILGAILGFSIFLAVKGYKLIADLSK